MLDRHKVGIDELIEPAAVKQTKNFGDRECRGGHADKGCADRFSGEQGRTTPPSTESVMLGLRKLSRV
jgi:hypothetical protein